MRGAWKRLGLAGLLLAMCVGVPLAQQAGDGARTQGVGIKIGGWYGPDSTYRIMRMDDNGNFYTMDADRDRDFSTVLGHDDGTHAACHLR